ncbi:MarR family winged helix-turn-helix transcriptional regulator [Clostridium beijerinckii]|uniref:Transcriptional regulator SlyA n=1 Tax=Clostridium beijerinckii TaxID=1520 RepID=A0A1S8S2F0_CLOBE|nr:MarR family transcriptional regulator [Clostridium beijerinckii]NRY62365.1 DNA-binding MarR family transcriptional regulator [Clostridium beijerinckii]OOM59651.1 transcriptional regulator SlyA [Clostridium beijerinckii]UYZ36547.1 MarR family transcriptional regulator [Clostridium beijerinckii]
MNEYYIQQIFSTIFYLSNKIQVQGDKMDERITVRQWMVLLTISHLLEDNASYSKIADKMGCTKQNVKHIIDSLQKKNYVLLEKNEKDKRAINIKITKECREIMGEYYEKGNKFLKDMFNNFEEKELENLWDLLKKIANYDGSNWTGYEERVNIWGRG